MSSLSRNFFLCPVATKSDFTRFDLVSTISNHTQSTDFISSLPYIEKHRGNSKQTKEKMLPQHRLSSQDRRASELLQGQLRIRRQQKSPKSSSSYDYMYYSSMENECEENGAGKNELEDEEREETEPRSASRDRNEQDILTPISTGGGTDELKQGDSFSSNMYNPMTSPSSTHSDSHATNGNDKQQIRSQNQNRSSSLSALPGRRFSEVMGTQRETIGLIGDFQDPEVERNQRGNSKNWLKSPREENGLASPQSDQHHNDDRVAYLWLMQRFANPIYDDTYSGKHIQRILWRNRMQQKQYLQQFSELKYGAKNLRHNTKSQLLEKLRHVSNILCEAIDTHKLLESAIHDDMNSESLLRAENVQLKSALISVNDRLQRHR